MSVNAPQCRSSPETISEVAEHVRESFPTLEAVEEYNDGSNMTPQLVIEEREGKIRSEILRTLYHFEETAGITVDAVHAYRIIVRQP